MSKSGTNFLKILWTSWGHVRKSETKFLKICCTHVPTSWGHVKNSGTKLLNTLVAPMYPLAGDMSKMIENLRPNFWTDFPKNPEAMFPEKSWHGMARDDHDTAWHAKIWHDTQKYGLAWHVKPWHGMAWHEATLVFGLPRNSPGARV